MNGLLVLALAVVTITPAYQELEVYKGMCAGRVRIYVPPHKDNYTLVIQISDGMADPNYKRGAPEIIEIPLSTGPEEQIRVFSLYADGHITFTAFVEDRNHKVRGTAVSLSVCPPKSTGGE